MRLVDKVYEVVENVEIVMVTYQKGKRIELRKGYNWTDMETQYHIYINDYLKSVFFVENESDAYIAVKFVKELM